MPTIQLVTLPRSPLYRVGRPPDPFVPPEWRYVRPDGTFGGRYDDPRGRRGVPSRDRYRVLYFASHPAGAYGESVAQFRPSVKVLDQYGGRMPFGIQPTIPHDWRVGRRLGAAVLSATLPLADLDAAETVQALRPVLAPVAMRLQIPDVDVSAITGPRRELTQEAGLHIYGQRDRQGAAALCGDTLRIPPQPRVGVLGGLRGSRAPSSAAGRSDRRRRPPSVRGSPHPGPRHRR